MQDRRPFSGDRVMTPALGRRVEIAWFCRLAVSASQAAVVMVPAGWRSRVCPSRIRCCGGQGVVFGVPHTHGTDPTWQTPDTARIRAGRRASGSGERPAIWRGGTRRVQQL